jgi:multidrug efflux pump subunit AcrA (membrane-fusion protein)
MKVLSADAQVVEGQAQVRTYAALLQYALAQEQENEANVEAAQLNDSYTKIFAPESWSGNSQVGRTGRLRPGGAKPACFDSFKHLGYGEL